MLRAEWTRYGARLVAIGSGDDLLVLMTALFYDMLEEAAAGMRDVMGAVNELLDPVIDRIAMLRRIADAIRRHARCSWRRGAAPRRGGG